MKSELGNLVFDTIQSMNKVRQMELQAAPPRTRHATQMEIERQIMAYRPDYLEANDMLDAFSAALKNRYEYLGDIEECFKWLKEALLEADQVSQDSPIREPDEMGIARQWRDRDL